MRLICIYFSVLCFFYHQFEQCSTESVSFMNAERIVITYVNDLLARDVTMKTYRISRSDPRHYLYMAGELLVPASNDLRVDFYFYQLLTSGYQPSFVELHFGFCDLVEKDPIFGSQIKRHADKLNVTCPYPPGKYNLTDMAIPFIPKNFPFHRGRIYVNVTLIEKGVSTRMGSAHVDMEIKSVIVNKKKHK